MRRLLAALLAVMLALPALAQQQGARSAPRGKKPAAQQAPAPAPKPAPPPANAQEKPLIELSEAIGALTFLTQICAPTTTPNPWRVRMEALIESESEATGLRERMNGAFNTGFADYSTTYRQCTEAARLARRILARDAARLARDLERRFGS